jgi:hypothetical protein
MRCITKGLHFHIVIGVPIVGSHEIRAIMSRLPNQSESAGECHIEGESIQVGIEVETRNNYSSLHRKGNEKGKEKEGGGLITIDASLLELQLCALIPVLRFDSPQGCASRMGKNSFTLIFSYGFLMVFLLFS